MINACSPNSIFAFLVLAICALPCSAGAQDYRIGSLHIDHPWAVATPKGAKVGAGYLKITNAGTQADRLIAITSSAAPRVQIHASVNEDGVVKMRALDKGLEIKPGETVVLKPEGAHVMFEGLRAPLLEASRVVATLVFEKAGIIEVDFSVMPLGTKAPTPAAQSHTH